MDLIRIKNVKKVYKNGVTAVNDISLNIKKGEFVFIIGETGCGKSSLIKMLYREEKPTSGEIVIGGVKVEKLKNRKVYKLRRKLGIVFQDFKLLPILTAYENVAFALEMYGLPKDEIREKTLKALDLVGLKEKAKSFPDELSGGEQQRVSIARALAKNPKILLCDEPTGALDSETGVMVLKLLLKMAREYNKTIVIVTHNSSIAEIADKIIRVRSGKIQSIDINKNPKNVDEVEW